MKNLFDVTGKVVVITGACGVLGQCIARYLAEQGAHVVILARAHSREKGKALEAELSQYTEALFLETDVLDEEKLVKNREDILAKFGTIDVLLNAAGGNMGAANIAPDQTYLDASDEDCIRAAKLAGAGTELVRYYSSDEGFWKGALRQEGRCDCEFLFRVGSSPIDKGIRIRLREVCHCLLHEIHGYGDGKEVLSKDQGECHRSRFHYYQPEPCSSY